ncbi:nucleobase:cation symporter-2 family protein [Niallia sp. 03190]|uniref:nucleobase:cation symporter-2 family protein n=1 Tax=Niallia sp. 03190 TaxID=3458061 RepID=UPI004043F53E
MCVMYGGAIAVPLIIAPAIGLTQEQLIYLVSFDLFTCGIATLIQVIGGKGVGIQLPVMMRISFTVVESIIAIGQIHSIQGVFGAVIVSGIVVTILSRFFSKIIPYFPPVVTGSIVLIIGASLMSVAMNYVAGGVGSEDFGSLENLTLAIVTLFTFLVCNTLLKGFLQVISVLISMLAGTFIAYLVGKVNLSAVSDAEWFVPITSFYFGMPTFDLSSILIMSLIAIIIMIESVGVFTALGEVCYTKIGEEQIKKGVHAEGIAVIFSGIFNSFNHTSFTQNVGLVSLTRVTNRYVVAVAGIMLILIGIFPKIAALAIVIPAPVLGGAMIPMFGMLITVSIQTLSKADLLKASNQVIVAVGLGISLGINAIPHAFDAFPETIRLVLGNGIVMGTLTLLFLNIILNKKERVEQKMKMAELSHY